MLHPLIAYDTAAPQKNAMLAQAATIAQARTAQRPWPRQPWKASVPAGLRGPATAAAGDGLILIREAVMPRCCSHSHIRSRVPYRGRCSVPRPGVMNRADPGSWTSAVCQTPRGLITA